MPDRPPTGPAQREALMRLHPGVPALVAVAALLVACPRREARCTVDATYAPVVDPVHFSHSTTVANPLMPLVPGITYTYVSGEDTDVVEVTFHTRVILGITCIEVHDTVATGGQVTEDTLDWYAQDDDGNVWYLGEDTKEYQGGAVASTEGSWEAGVGGAKPGILMHAVQPAAGVPYRQEYLACQAEDMAEVVSLAEAVTVPHGSYTGCLKTREFTPLEPEVNEWKYYCSGVGLVLEVDVANGARNELVQVTAP